MIELPDKYKIKIINRHGLSGEKWLNSIDAIVDKYTSQFQLEDVQLTPNLSMNIVLFAKSPQYGNVVMKLGAPNKTSITEIEVMKYYSSTTYVPKCYYSCINNRVMILERISPGYTLLDSLQDIEERVKIFSDISNHLLVASNGKEDFPICEELFREKVEYAYEHKQTYSDILWMIDIANNIYTKIKKRNLPKYILHGDLHHKNILKAKNGWKAIDPHGIIGERVIEASQFIRTELEHINLEDSQINQLIFLLSKYFKEDSELILETLFVNIIEKIIWYIKNKYDSDRISFNINICKKLLSYINVR